MLNNIHLVSKWSFCDESKYLYLLFRNVKCVMCLSLCTKNISLVQNNFLLNTIFYFRRMPLLLLHQTWTKILRCNSNSYNNNNKPAIHNSKFQVSLFSPLHSTITIASSVDKILSFAWVIFINCMKLFRDVSGSHLVYYCVDWHTRKGFSESSSSTQFLLASAAAFDLEGYRGFIVLDYGLSAPFTVSAPPSLTFAAPKRTECCTT